jgi:tetratricopeptide (TPR) repeat protein
LLAEFYAATGYLDRLLFAFTDLAKIHLTPKGKIQLQKLSHDSVDFFCHTFCEFQIISDDYKFEMSEFKNHIIAFHQFIESLTKLPITSDLINKNIIEYINLIYRNAYEIHHFISETTDQIIQLPRNGLADCETITKIKNTINHNGGNQISHPLFFLDLEKIQDISQQDLVLKSPIAFLEIKRDEKYAHFIHCGHNFISQKNYQEAISSFYKARNYKDTAEVLTLIAWSYSLLENISEAKKYCMKAIQKDTQYGPAYNDFGNYILNEGLIKESLRWFELAKRAHNYENREYPYINAGRAYILLKQYEAGLHEFSLALTLAPHHLELHETVAKLRNNLDLETQSTTQM